MRKFRMAYQHDTMQCGVACLRMVCMAYGMDYSLQSQASVEHIMNW